jgi:hypothetical protein
LINMIHDRKIGAAIEFEQVFLWKCFPDDGARTVGN